MTLSAAPLPSSSRVRALLLALLLVASTAFGTLSPTSTAAAASAPGAPTSVVGTSANAGVALSWVAPASTGGSLITEYRVRYSTNNGSSWSSALSTKSPSPQYTVTRLTNGRSYVFQVRATNRVGNGPWSATSIAVIPASAPPPAPGLVQKVAVPSYIYPGSTWAQLEAGAPPVGLAIINPNSGPGDSPNPDYVSQVNSSKAKGITVIGYVHTSYTLRPLENVKAEVDRYFQWYGVDGIFFDEVTSSCASYEYYSKLNRYVKAKRGVGKVVLNPGTNSGECYMKASDIIIMFENDYTQYAGWQPSGWESRYPASEFWHLVINTPTSSLAQAVALSKSRNIGWVYVTDDNGLNPWDSLPSYWSDLLTLASTP